MTVRRGLQELGWSGKESLGMIFELRPGVNGEETVCISGGRAFVMGE